MKYILRLSGEHPALPLAELKGVLDGEGLVYEIGEEFSGRLIVLDVESDDSHFIHRLALITKACEYLDLGDDLGKISGTIYKRISRCESFAVRSSSERLEKELGGLLFERGLKVNLRNPGIEVSLFKVKEKYLAGRDIPLERDFNARRAQYRPFFSPTSMHPKIARVMVNLAAVKKGGSVLDPFCGTGGLLIEAGLMGLRISGYDISEKTAGGCRQNLSHFGLSGEIIEQDALTAKPKKIFDAIVTDPPYGRASYTSQREVWKLYAEFLRMSLSLLKGGGRLIIMLPGSRKISPDGFKVDGFYDVRVHKSLTRRIWVLSKVT